MIDALRHAIERIEQLPDDLQAEAAARIESLASELADRKWEVLFADPATAVFLDELCAEAEAEELDTPHGLKPGGFSGYARPNGPR
jgi:hypothetical protein